MEDCGSVTVAVVACALFETEYVCTGRYTFVLCLCARWKIYVSESSAGTPLLSAAGGGAPGNAFFNKLIDANLIKALYEFLSSEGDPPTIDLTRLIKRIQGLGYRLSERQPQAQQSSSGETLRKPNNGMDQKWDNDHWNELIGSEPQAEQHEGSLEPEYLGSERTSGASSGTEGALPAITLFWNSVVSPKLELTYASKFPGVKQPDRAATLTPALKWLVVVQTESSPMLAAMKPTRDKRKVANRPTVTESVLVRNRLRSRHPLRV